MNYKIIRNVCDFNKLSQNSNFKCKLKKMVRRNNYFTDEFNVVHI
jgi:hypothetical protein